MFVYVVIAEDREEINFDDGECCLVRTIYGVYRDERSASNAELEAKDHHDYVFTEQHMVE